MEEDMRRLCLATVCTLLLAASAFAQSSGNFNAAGTNAACGIDVGGKFNGGTAVTLLTTYVKTSNGNGVTLDIRPNLVTGLFTDTKISATVPLASADIGIQVCVKIDGSTSGLLSPPCVVYDERFQQVSSQLFSVLTECALSTTAVACHTNADCATAGLPGDFCQITDPTATPPSGVCAAPNPLCNFDLILSTLSAHSYDFIAQVPGDNKPHAIVASWSLIGASNTNAGGSTASCVGPGVLTVTQTKVFPQNSNPLAF